LNTYSDAVSAPPLHTDLIMRDVAAVLRRRRGIVLCICLVCMALAVVKCIFSTRRYEGVAAIQIQKDDSDALGLESALGTAEAGASDALDYNITLQTQARVLTSDTLALRVIRDDSLEANDDFTGIHSWLRIPTWLTPWDKPSSEDANLSLEDDPERRRRALKTFEKHLTVKIEPGTRIINISFLSTSPETAAGVVNHLIEEFSNYNFTTRSQATAKVSEWLKGQLDGIERQANASQEKVLRIERENGLFAPDEEHNVVLTRLDELNHDLVANEADRIMAQALENAAATGNPEDIGMLTAGSSGAPASGAVLTLAPIQQLRARETELKARLQQDMTKYDRSYPLILQQQAQLLSVQSSIQDEIVRIRKRAHNNVEVAVSAENAARKSFQTQRSLVQKLSAGAMEFVVAKEDADASRELLEGLKKKIENAKLLSGFKASNVTVVDPGRIPSRKHARQPNIPVTMLAGSLCGLCLGCITAFLVDNHDKGIHSADQIENLLGAPPFAVLPSFKAHRGWQRSLPQLHVRARLKSPSGDAVRMAQRLVPLDSGSNYAEALRSLRTSLMLSRSQQYPKVILLTSAQPGEGKSTTALHLATILGQQGRRVLVIDADLRRPTLHEKLDIPNMRGLSTMLSEVDAPTALRSIGGRDDVWVLTAGPRPPYPAELLSSPRLQSLLKEWRENFDFILIDSPPSLAVTDAVLLSPLVDITLLIARQSVSTMHGIKSAYRKLNANGNPVNVAVVLNGVEPTSSDYADYYGYSYTDKADAGAKPNA
jgi:succinoglycan biosynthesis transport protein ExoP